MSRSDLLIQLAEAGAQNDHAMLERTVDALVAEARARQHNTLADRLAKIVGKGAVARVPRPVGGVFLTEKVRDLIVERPATRSLSDLTLPNDVAAEIDDFCKEQHRADILRAHSLEPRNRVMLVGPPGNGKTSLAEAIAYQLAVPLFVARYDAIVGSYLGETASRLKRIFDFVRTTPCVIFFDEFDAIGKERGDIHETGEIKRVVSSLLLQIDDLPSYSVIVCATNHPELLDTAVWRRFQLRIELSLPTPKQIRKVIEDCERELGERFGSKEWLARSLQGASFAEIEDFLLDVRRKLVLSDTPTTANRVAKQQLAAWRRRYKAADSRSIPDNAEPHNPAEEDRDG